MRAFQMRPLFGLLAAGVLGISVCACGSADKSASPAQSIAHVSTTSGVTATSEHAESSTNAQAEGTSLSSSSQLGDDRAGRRILSFGHAADASNAQVITALVRRYYRAEAAENGAAACSMLYSTYEESVPEDYGTSPPGPAYARGTTCPAVMTLVFKHFHGQIAARLPKLKVSRVRLSGHQGVVVLSFGSMPEREIHVDREGRTWKVVALMDAELP